MRTTVLLLFVAGFAAGCIRPDRRSACEATISDLRAAVDAAQADDLSTFRDAYARALPRLAPTRDALFDLDSNGYPFRAAGSAWELNEVVTMLLAARAAGDSSAFSQLDGFVARNAAALDSVLTATAGECDVL